MARIMPPIAVAISMLDRINHADADGIGELLAGSYYLKVFDEPAQHGRESGIEGWRGYAGSFPNYIIYPHQFAVSGDTVAIRGHTTGSHLGLPDAEEARHTLIWVAEVRGGLIASWVLIEDTAENRDRYQL